MDELISTRQFSSWADRPALIKNNSNSTLEKITLYSILGQEVETLKFDKNFEKEIVIDVSHLSSVVYIIKLVTNKGIITQKIKF